MGCQCWCHTWSFLMLTSWALMFYINLSISSRAFVRFFSFFWLYLSHQPRSSSKDWCAAQSQQAKQKAWSVVSIEDGRPTRGLAAYHWIEKGQCRHCSVPFVIFRNRNPSPSTSSSFRHSRMVSGSVIYNRIVNYLFDETISQTFLIIKCVCFFPQQQKWFRNGKRKP